MDTALIDSGVAAPPSGGAAVLPLLLPGHKAGAAFAALDFPAEPVAVGVSRPQRAIPVSLFQLLLHHVPELPVDDRRVVIPDDHQLLLTVVGLFGVGEIVRGNGFFLYQIPHILLIFQKLHDTAPVPPDAAPVGSVARLPQLPGDHRGSLLLHAVLVKDQAYQLRALWICCQASILYIIAQQGTAEHHPLLHPPGLAPLHPAGGLAALLLGDGAHNGQPKLGVRLQGTDAVVHKQYAHTQGLQLPGVGNGVQDVPGEAAHLLGEDELKLSHAGVGDHLVERRPLFGGGAGDPLVGVDLVQLPLRLAVDVCPEIPLLALKGVGLVVLVGGHTAVGCHFDHGVPPPPSAPPLRRRWCKISSACRSCASLRMPSSFRASRTARCMWNQNSGSVSSVTVRMPLICSSLACSVILTAPFVPRVCCGQGRLSCHVWQPALETLLFPHTFLDQPRFLYFI